MSEKTQTPLQSALSEIMSEAGYVQKDAKNDFHRYKYASADAVLTKVREACAKRGVAITGTTAEVVELNFGQDHKGKPQLLAVVRISQQYALGEESVTFQGLGSGADSSDKAVMKANTAALKYLLSNAFNISWGDDPEADTSVDEAASAPKSAKPAGKTRKKAKPKAAAPSREDLEKRIAEAATQADLDKVRDLMLAHLDKKSDTFAALRTAVTEKRQEIDAKG